MSDLLDGAVPERHRAQFKVKGMTCGACVASIETMLGQQKGIESVNVALLAERAVVEYDADAGWTPEKIAEEIDDIGFEAEVVEEKSTEHVTLSVYGMTCASCTSSVGECLCGLVSGNVYGASAAAPGASAGARTPAALAGRPTLFPELACGRLARRLAALDAAIGQHVRVLVLP